MEGGGNAGGMNREIPYHRGDPLKSKYRFEASGGRSSRERGWVCTGHDNVSPLTSSQNTAVCPCGPPIVTSTQRTDIDSNSHNFVFEILQMVSNCSGILSNSFALTVPPREIKSHCPTKYKVRLYKG